MNIRHVILDRDGVLNREAPAHGYILSVAEFQWLPGALDALALLHRAGLRLSVATNQSAVGRGLMDLARLEEILDHMRAAADAAGGRLDAVYYCPHGPDQHCDCRKPRPGLLTAAIADSGIDAAHTLFAGDDVRDVEAALAAGITPVLLRTGKGRRAEEALHARGLAIAVHDDLLQFAQALTGAGARS